MQDWNLTQYLNLWHTELNTQWKGWFVLNPNVSLEHNKMIEFPLHRSPGTLPLRLHTRSPRGGFTRAPYGNTRIYFWSFLFSLGLNSCTYYVQYNTNPIGLLHCVIRHYSDYVILLFSEHSQELTWSHFFDEGRSTGAMHTSDCNCNACRMSCYTSSCMSSTVSTLSLMLPSCGTFTVNSSTFFPLISAWFVSQKQNSCNNVI